MNPKIKIGCIVGTRPEVIKMAPIIYGLRRLSQFETTIIATAQHRNLLDDMFDVFQLSPDIDLNVMSHNQSLAKLTAVLCEKLDHLFAHNHYDIWLAQGDTTTTLAASLVAFYHRVCFGHIEAGLRTHDLAQPFPEELNRVLVSHSAMWSFVPTKTEEQNLLREGIKPSSIFVTGNTVIDALYMMLDKQKHIKFDPYPNKRMLLITAHRRENFGKPLENICQALITLSQMFPDVVIVYPAHPNLNVQATVNKILRHQPNIELLPPLHYNKFIQYMQAAYLIMTDSGGIQEEAPALKKPVLILRDTTERPALLTTGTGILVGTDPEKIISATTRLLQDKEAYEAMANGHSPYGDGHAAERIIQVISDWATTPKALARHHF